jgi:peptidoglycan/LPS O-acetylase OafA/YrhL
MTQKSTAEILPLTSLRFFLATWVVLFHLNVTLWPVTQVQASGASPLLNTIFCAYVAVGIFFVLSGFVLALNYPLDKPWTSAERTKFGIARFSRIYPVYVLALAAISPLILGTAIATHATSTLLRRTVSGVLNLLMIQAWVPHAVLSWNAPGWSLSCEAFFYLCFALAGGSFFKFKSFGGTILAMLGLWAVALVAPMLSILARVPGYSNAVATDRPDFAFAWFAGFNPLLNLPMFLSGIVACRCFLIVKQTGKLTGKGYLLYVPSFAVLFALTSFGNRIPYPLMHNGITLPASIGVVIGLAIGDRYLCALFTNRILVFLGQASYAEYLLHFPIRAAFEWLQVYWSPLAQVLYLTAVLAVSSVVFHFYEEPLQRKLRTLLTLKRSVDEARSPIASTGVSAVAAFSSTGGSESVRMSATTEEHSLGKK